MFNFSKQNVDQKTDRLAQQSNDAVEEIASQVRTTTQELLDAVEDTANFSQDKAKDLIRTLKTSIDELTSESSVSYIAGRVSEGASKFKDHLQHEIKDTACNLRDKAADAVQEKPIGTLLLVAGLGLLIGYHCASKKHNENY